MRALVIGLALGVCSVALLSPPAGASDNVVALSGGGGHTCGLWEDGGVRCWGLNDDGQLGDGTNESSVAPVDVTGLDGGAEQVSAGPTHTCAVTAGGEGRCWGENGGRLGDGTEDSRAAPVAVCADAACTSNLTGVVSIAAGGSHSCAALDDGGVVCWGNNEDGQLGNGSTDDSLTPVAVTGLSGVLAVSLGTSSSCALTNAGAVFCWGSNGEGQIGDDRACGMRCPAPQAVAGLGGGVAQLSVGGLHACALAVAGAALCWGFNFDGQVGDGTSGGIRIVPTQVIGLESGVTAVAAGGGFRGHACALLDDGTLRCWGDNDAGQVGDGTEDDRNAPVAVSDLDGVTQVFAGDAHMCAMRGRDILCWGANESGQLGDGTEIERHTPVLAVGLAKQRGDANCDGQVSSVDAALILQSTAQLLAELPCAANADANASGAIDAVDAALVLQVKAGIIGEL